MFNCLCINDLFALQRYKNFWTFLLFSLCFKALSTIYLQVGNFSQLTQINSNSKMGKDRLDRSDRIYPRIALIDQIESIRRLH